MILDAGICYFYDVIDRAAPGDMPKPTYRKKHAGWFAELNYETAPVHATEFREDMQIDRRIRILQHRALSNLDVVTFGRERKGVALRRAEKFRILRAYHGVDDDSGQLITDLTLQRIEDA